MYALNMCSSLSSIPLESCFKRKRRKESAEMKERETRWVFSVGSLCFAPTDTNAKAYSKAGSLSL